MSRTLIDYLGVAGSTGLLVASDTLQNAASMPLPPPWLNYGGLGLLAGTLLLLLGREQRRAKEMAEAFAAERLAQAERMAQLTDRLVELARQEAPVDGEQHSRGEP